jgi:hypothetical protein
MTPCVNVESSWTRVIEVKILVQWQRVAVSCLNIWRTNESVQICFSARISVSTRTGILYGYDFCIHSGICFARGNQRNPKMQEWFAKRHLYAIYTSQMNIFMHQLFLMKICEKWTKLRSSLFKWCDLWLTHLNNKARKKKRSSLFKWRDLGHQAHSYIQPLWLSGAPNTQSARSGGV